MREDQIRQALTFLQKNDAKCIFKYLIYFSQECFSRGKEKILREDAF